MPARVKVRALVGPMLALLVLAPQAGRAQTGDDPVVATVNGEPVRRAEVMAEMGALPAHYRELPLDQLYPVVLNRIIDGRLLLAEALKRKLDDDPKVRQRVIRLRNRMVQEELLDRHVRQQVTDELVRERYARYLERNPTVRGVSARNILVETEEEARQVIEALKAGADFEALAKARSLGPTASRGGDLGRFGPDEMMREISDAAFGMEPGTFSQEPVESPFGWHVILVEELSKVQPLSFEQVRDELVTALSKQVIAELVAELRRDARITRFNIDGTAAPEGMFDVPAPATRQ